MREDGVIVVLKSSYIFLEHPNKKPSSCEDENGNVVLVLGTNVNGFVNKAFPSAIKDISQDDIFRTKLDCSIVENNGSYSVSFIITQVEKITYLDAIISGKERSKLIAALEQVQEKLFDSDIRQHYIDIVSYDAISEHYCNKIFVKLNTLERNLRKLLFNIYILHFGKDYYSATMDTGLQEKIKGLIGTSNAKEYQREVKEKYNVNTEQAKAIIRLQQFFYSFEFTDIQKFLFTPNWTSIDERERLAFLDRNKDLSDLSDDELRKAFDEFKPKSDWERFFSCKIKISEIEEIIDEIRKYRNAVAHLKFFYKDDYCKCNKLIAQLNKAILEAIKLTEEKDFEEKNAESLSKALSGFTKRITEIMNPIRESIIKFFQSESFQVLNNISTLFKESGIIQNPEIAALQTEQYINPVEENDLIDEDDTEEDDNK